MRLINTETLKLEAFVSDTAPAYAILSHTWGAEELTLQEFEQSNGREKVGFQKIQYTCDEARSHGIPYAWIDTVCIDKASSADLSEAINSMWRWYKNAKVCYAYLQDVTTEDVANLNSEHSQERQESAPSSEAVDLLPDTRWTRRGWTLQELLAPREVRFFSAEWHEFGTKSSLADALSAQTRIDVEILQGQRSIYEESVATRMSWAAGRETTRIEDQSYCLLGIFDVNMPLLYGEGEKAFIRLQQEILRDSDDESIFTWVDLHADPDSLCGLLAKSPWMFRHSAKYVPYRDWGRPHFPTTTSNVGTSLFVILKDQSPTSPGADRIAHIRCRFSNDNMALRVREISRGLGQYARVSSHSLLSTESPTGTPQNIFVRQRPVLPLARDTFAPVEWSFDGFHADRHLHYRHYRYETIVSVSPDGETSSVHYVNSPSLGSEKVTISGLPSECACVFFVKPRDPVRSAFFILLGSAGSVGPNAVSRPAAFSVQSLNDLGLRPDFLRSQIPDHADDIYSQFRPMALFGETLQVKRGHFVGVKVTQTDEHSRSFVIEIRSDSNRIRFGSS